MLNLPQARVYGGGSVLPPVPSRDRVCAVRTTGMQGLMVTTRQFGVLPWWDAALAWLDAENRQAVYAAKRAVGDTHQLIELPCGPPLYDEEGQAYSPDRFGALDWMRGNTAVDPQLQALVTEVIRAGFTPVLFLGGDDGENGYPIAVRQLPLIIAALGPLTAYTLLVPGWDGVFYGWTPEHIVAFGALFRSLCPQGYLAIEHSTGHIPLGEGPSDWYPTGRMRHYDVLLSEFDPEDIHQDSTWQISARLVPSYHRPADQPQGDDPSAPWYLRDGSPRGPFYAVAFEYATYEWVRGRSVQQVEADRAYLRSLGWAYVG